MNKFIWILVMMAWVFVADAAVYKWTDEQGRTHYSDRPFDGESQQMHVAPSPKPDHTSSDEADRAETRQRMLDIYREERTQKRQLAAEQKQEKAKRKRMCHQARYRYENFVSSTAIYDLDENGERRFLDHMERERFVANLKSDVGRWCAN